MAIKGCEDFRHILRALTSIELHKNADYYAFHPHFNVVWSREHADKDSEHTPFLVSLNEEASKPFSTRDGTRQDSVKKEAFYFTKQMLELPSLHHGSL